MPVVLREGVMAVAGHRQRARTRPQAVMCDKSDAIITAALSVFPNAEVRLCYFHVMQAFGRWLKSATSGVTDGTRQPAE